MNRNYTVTEETKKKLGWSKGLTKETDKRVKKRSDSNIGHHTLSPESRRKISNALKKRFANPRNHPCWGKNSPLYGRKLLEEHKIKISKTLTGRALSQEHRQKISALHKGKPLSKGHKKKLSESHKGIQAGNRHPMWLGGKSFEPYTMEFNRQLKELIRDRDGYKCQKCGCPEIENSQKLTVHHIDYDKKNCLPSNLISLCNRCNFKVNSNRKKWTKFFQKKVKSIKSTSNLQLSFHK